MEKGKDPNVKTDIGEEGTISKKKRE